MKKKIFKEQKEFTEVKNVTTELTEGRKDRVEQLSKTTEHEEGNGRAEPGKISRDIQQLKNRNSKEKKKHIKQKRKK